MKILFITRKYPPTIGGLENAAYQLNESLSKRNNVKLIKWGGSNKYLPFVLPSHFIRACLAMIVSRRDIIYIQDCLLAPLGYVLKVLFNRPVIVTAAGLDLTYENWIYQKFFVSFVKKMNFVICISEETKLEAMKRGVESCRTAVIPYGVEENTLAMSQVQATQEIEGELNISISGKVVLLSLGRIVERKGIHWFIKKVLPKLLKKYKNIHYLIAGDGPYRKRIELLVKENKLEEYVTIIGRVTDATKQKLYIASDIFIMPNIPVRGDMEGQGLVMLEATMSNRPVVASDLEGISSTITHNQNGILVHPKDEHGFVSSLVGLCTNKSYRNELGTKGKIFTTKKFGWGTISKQYEQVFGSIIHER